jgi:hypothetical protein
MAILIERRGRPVAVRIGTTSPTGRPHAESAAAYTVLPSGARAMRPAAAHAPDGDRGRGAT